jgi:hypothetical protein
MVFWQLSIDANDPALLARFWAQALGYQPLPPTEPDTTWHTHYRARLGASQERRIEIVETKVAELVAHGASVERRTRDDNPDDPVYFVVMHDPEGNEFCIS